MPLGVEGLGRAWLSIHIEPQLRVSEEKEARGGHENFDMQLRKDLSRRLRKGLT